MVMKYKLVDFVVLN